MASAEDQLDKLDIDTPTHDGWLARALDDLERELGEWPKWIRADFEDRVARKLAADRDRLAKERDEADRRAGAAERQLAYAEETVRSSRHWMSERKRELGYSNNASFDDVWAAAIARAENAEAERDEFRRLLGAMK